MTDSPEFRRQQAEMQELRGFLENTMTEKKQPEALRIADVLRSMPLGEVDEEAYVMLYKQHALIEEMREALKEICNEAEVFGGGFAEWIQDKCIQAIAASEPQS